MHVLLYSRLETLKEQHENSRTNSNNWDNASLSPPTPILEYVDFPYEEVAEQDRHRIRVRNLPGSWCDYPSVRRITDLATSFARNRLDHSKPHRVVAGMRPRSES